MALSGSRARLGVGARRSEAKAAKRRSPFATLDPLPRWAARFACFTGRNVPAKQRPKAALSDQAVGDREHLERRDNGRLGQAAWRPRRWTCAHVNVAGGSSG